MEELKKPDLEEESVDKFEGEWYFRDIIIPAVKDRSLFTEAFRLEEGEKLRAKDPVSMIKEFKLTSITDLMVLAAKIEKNYPEYSANVEEHPQSVIFSVTHK